MFVFITSFQKRQKRKRQEEQEEIAKKEQKYSHVSNKIDENLRAITDKVLKKKQVFPAITNTSKIIRPLM